MKWALCVHIVLHCMSSEMCSLPANSKQGRISISKEAFIPMDAISYFPCVSSIQHLDFSFVSATDSSRAEFRNNMGFCSMLFPIFRAFLPYLVVGTRNSKKGAKWRPCLFFRNDTDVMTSFSCRPGFPFRSAPRYRGTEIEIGPLTEGSFLQRCDMAVICDETRSLLWILPFK